MKVYIVTNGSYEYYSIEKVFLSREKAQEFVDNFDDIKLEEELNYYRQNNLEITSDVFYETFSDNIKIEEYEVEDL